MLRVGELVTELNLTLTGAAEAQAGLGQLIVPAAGPDEDAPVADEHPEPPGAGHDDETHAQDGGEAGAEGGDGTLPLPDLLGSPTFTPAEIEVLTELAKRRDDLAARERELGLREGLLQAAERRLDDKIVELRGIRAEIEQLVQLHNEREEAELQSLVKIYETMKPKDAARILGELELDVLLTIMERMKERSTAPVLAAMDPSRAREVTAELAQRRDLREPNG